MVVSVIVILGNHSYRCACSVGMLSVWYEYREKLPGFIKKLLVDKWLRDNIGIWSSRNNPNNVGCGKRGKGNRWDGVVVVRQ
ncbi:MAG: hypothetical protein AB1489_30775 [Acidobacteriota bacterium]